MPAFFKSERVGAPDTFEPIVPCVVFGRQAEGEYVTSREIQWCARCGRNMEDAKFDPSARLKWLVLRPVLRAMRIFKSTACSP